MVGEDLKSWVAGTGEGTDDGNVECDEKSAVYLE
jgi:hypothetical protein